MRKHELLRRCQCGRLALEVLCYTSGPEGNSQSNDEEHRFNNKPSDLLLTFWLEQRCSGVIGVRGKVGSRIRCQGNGGLSTHKRLVPLIASPDSRPQSKRISAWKPENLHALPDLSPAMVSLSELPLSEEARVDSLEASLKIVTARPQASTLLDGC